jgi:hypothetical protein
LQKKHFIVSKEFLLLTNYEKASKLYDHCAHHITQDQQLKFLDCLEHSGNYPALEILDPTRRRQPPEPTDRNLNNKPTLSTDNIDKNVKTFDVAKTLHDNANLKATWKILKDVIIK